MNAIFVFNEWHWPSVSVANDSSLLTMTLWRRTLSNPITQWNFFSCIQILNYFWRQLDRHTIRIQVAIPTYAELPTSGLTILRTIQPVCFRLTVSTSQVGLILLEILLNGNSSRPTLIQKVMGLAGQANSVQYTLYSADGCECLCVHRHCRKRGTWWPVPTQVSLWTQPATNGVQHDLRQLRRSYRWDKNTCTKQHTIFEMVWACGTALSWH